MTTPDIGDSRKSEIEKYVALAERCGAEVGRYEGEMVEMKFHRQSSVEAFVTGIVMLSRFGTRPAAEPANPFLKALDIRIEQGWQLGGNACPVLYTDTINGEQVCRDDLWLATTAGLKSAAEPSLSGSAGEAYRVFLDGNAWCAVGPDFDNLQNSLATFADTPYHALELLCEADADKKRNALRANDWKAAPTPAEPAQQDTAPAGFEKMRGGKPVTFWRDDALEAAAGIVEAYGADPQIATDIRAMKGSQVARALKDWARGIQPATGSES